MFVRLCLNIAVLTMLFSGQKTPTVFILQFSPFLCIIHLLERFEGFVGSFLGSDIEFLWTLTNFQGSIFAAIFRCIEQGESLIFLAEGFSTFHYGLDTRHPDKPKRSRHRWKNVKFHKENSQN